MESILDLLQNFNFKLNKFDILGVGDCALNALKHADSKISQGFRVGKIILVFPHFIESNIESNVDFLKKTQFIESKIAQNQFSLFAPKQECYKITRDTDISNIPQILTQNSIDLKKITKKSSLFIAFLIENGNIATLKTQKLSDFLSQYGICFVIKEHLLLRNIIKL